MKIAFVYDAIYPWVKGGAEKRIYELGKRLAQRGDEVHVFGVKWWDGPDMIENESMVLHGVCQRMDLYVKGKRSIYEAFVFSIRLVPHLIREKFDLIDVTVFPYISCFSVKFVSIFRRSTIINTWLEVWGDYWYEYLGHNGIFGKTVEYLVSKFSSRSIAISSLTKIRLESIGVRGKNVHILPSGIDFEKISVIPPSDFKSDIIYVGRLIKEKNVDALIEAMDYVRRTLPDVKCYIIGDGPEYEKLIELSKGLGTTNNVRFFGFMDDNDVIAGIKSSKVLVLPSSREGFGMVVIEAFACGVPVITVNAPMNAARSLVNDENGIVVNLDPRDLSSAILRLLNDEALRGRMSGSALNAAEEFDWNKIAGQLSHLYEEAIQ